MDAPQNFQALQAKLLSSGPKLARRLRQAADYMIRHPDEVALGTAASVAKSADVQASTLVRFAQALGFAGFTDMQSVFRDHLRNRLPDYSERLRALHAETQASDGAAHLLAGFSNAATDSLRALVQNVSRDVLDHAIEALSEAQTIHLAGQRRSFGVVHHLAYSLRQMRVNVALIDNLGGLGPEQTAGIGAKDALIVVSFAPYAPLSVQAAEAARRAGASVVAITDSPLSPIAQGAAACFEVVEKDFGAFRTQAATMCLAMTLAVGVAKRRAVPTAPPKRRSKTLPP